LPVSNERGLDLPGGTEYFPWAPQASLSDIALARPAASALAQNRRTPMGHQRAARAAAPKAAVPPSGPAPAMAKAQFLVLCRD